MKKITLTVSVLALMALMAVTAVTADDTTSQPESQKPPAIPNTPAAVDDVVYARTFTLEKGYPFEWCKERTPITEGTILVLKVKPDLVFPRQALEPVLYVGNKTAERVNVGYKSGYVIAIVPGKVDLTKAPIWFGTPELPDRVDANRVDAERKLANKASIRAFSEKQIKAANQLGGTHISFVNRDDLRRNLAPLVRKYAPQEESLAKSLELIPDPKAKADVKPDPDED